MVRWPCTPFEGSIPWEQAAELLSTHRSSYHGPDHHCPSSNPTINIASGRRASCIRPKSSVRCLVVSAEPFPVQRLVDDHESIAPSVQICTMSRQRCT